MNEEKTCLEKQLLSQEIFLTESMFSLARQKQRI